jgi:hypothetical protein
LICINDEAPSRI